MDGSERWHRATWFEAMTSLSKHELFWSLFCLWLETQLNKGKKWCHHSWKRFLFNVRKSGCFLKKIMTENHIVLSYDMNTWFTQLNSLRKLSSSPSFIKSLVVPQRQHLTQAQSIKNKHLFTFHGQADILVQVSVAHMKPDREHLSYSQSKNVNTLNSCQNGTESLTVRVAVDMLAPHVCWNKVQSICTDNWLSIKPQECLHVHLTSERHLTLMSNEWAGNSETGCISWECCEYVKQTKRQYLAYHVFCVIY